MRPDVPLNLLTWCERGEFGTKAFGTAIRNVGDRAVPIMRVTTCVTRPVVMLCSPDTVMLTRRRGSLRCCATRSDTMVASEPVSRSALTVMVRPESAIRVTIAVARSTMPDVEVDSAATLAASSEAAGFSAVEDGSDETALGRRGFGAREMQERMMLLAALTTPIRRRAE